MCHRKYSLLILCFSTIACCLAKELSAELLYSGRAQSFLYNYENLYSTTPAGEAEDNFRFYQYLRLNLKQRGGKSSVSFHTYLRVTDDFNVDYSDDPYWRFYNGYLKWDTRRASLTVGRQWVHLGPGSLTLDGANLSVDLAGKSKLTGYLGLESPYSRRFSFQGWEKARSGGLYFTTKKISRVNLGIGFYQKNRHGEVAFREAGINAKAALPGGWKLNSRLDVNLLEDKVQKGLLRLRYQGHERINFFGEYKHYQPRLFYQSYFRRFKPKANDQLRGGLTYFLTPAVTLNTTYSAVFFEDENSGYLSLSAACPHGWLTYYRGDGFGGDEDGFVVGASLPVKEKFELFADIDYSRYRFYEEEDRDYLFSSIFGVNWRPSRELMAGVEFQDLNNDTLSKDFRLLLKFAYNFSSAF